VKSQAQSPTGPVIGRGQGVKATGGLVERQRLDVEISWNNECVVRYQTSGNRGKRCFFYRRDRRSATSPSRAAFFLLLLGELSYPILSADLHFYTPHLAGGRLADRAETCGQSSPNWGSICNYARSLVLGEFPWPFITLQPASWRSILRASRSSQVTRRGHRSDSSAHLTEAGADWRTSAAMVFILCFSGTHIYVNTEHEISIVIYWSDMAARGERRVLEAWTPIWSDFNASQLWHDEVTRDAPCI